MANVFQVEQPIEDGKAWNGDGKQATDLVVTHSDGVRIEVTTSQPKGTTLPENPAVKSLPASYYDKFFSDAAKNRRPSPIRSLFPLESRPGMISFLAGKPNASTFPFSSFKFTAASPADGQEVELSIEGDILSESLQYGATAGMPRFNDWLVGLQEHSHKRKRDEGWRISVGSGSQDLIYKAVNCMINPGDPVLMESPTYPGVIPMFQSLHCDIVEVPIDEQGIRADKLRKTLAEWPVGKPKPKVLYTIPYGCNPTGMTTATERRKEVLALAREHDFIILEDDPYYYLYFGEAPRPQSYFTLELELPEVGHVLRFDSLSKILSAGMRVGFASGPEPLLAAIDRFTATSNLQSSSLTQAVAVTLLESWGYENFWVHTRKVSAFYREQRDVFEFALRKHLSGLAEWTTPQAGMFVWFKLLLNPPGTEGSASAESADDSETIIRTKAVEQGVLALPGTVFLPNGGKTAYVRASFSLTPKEDVDEALRRLREVVLEFRKSAS